jgi:phosphoglucomutase
LGDQINKYTLGKTHKEKLISIFAKSFPNETLKVAIAYDCRHNSKELAQTVCPGFKCKWHFMFAADLRPTPLLSYTVEERKELPCRIVLTAESQPTSITVIKCTTTDGGQLVHTTDKQLLRHIEEHRLLNYYQIQSNDLFHLLDKSDDQAFIDDSVAAGKVAGDVDRSKVDRVYQPTRYQHHHFTRYLMIAAGYTDLHIVKEQAVPDGDFSQISNQKEPGHWL